MNASLAETNGSWVVEGDYFRKIGNLVLDQTTDVICKYYSHQARSYGLKSNHFETGLDPPFILSFSRLIKRTFGRILGWEAQCSVGCDDTWRNFFSRENILLYGIKVHRLNRQQNQDRLDRIGLGIGTDVSNRRMRRIGGWGGQMREWLDGVQEMISAARKYT